MTSQPNSQQSPPQSAGANNVGGAHRPDEDTRSGAENVNQNSAAPAGDGPGEGVQGGTGDLHEPGRHEQQPTDSNATHNIESRHIAESPRHGEPSTTSSSNSNVAAENRNVRHEAVPGQTSAATEEYGQNTSTNETQSAHAAQPGHPGAASTSIPPDHHPAAGQPTTVAAEGHHPAATRGTAAGSTVSKGVKGIVSGVHGAGEAIRGNINAGLDEAFGHTAGAEKNRQVAEQGVQEMRGGREARRV